jgi:hypothetical protein
MRVVDVNRLYSMERNAKLLASWHEYASADNSYSVLLEHTILTSPPDRGDRGDRDEHTVLYNPPGRG